MFGILLSKRFVKVASALVICGLLLATGAVAQNTVTQLNSIAISEARSS